MIGFPSSGRRVDLFRESVVPSFCDKAGKQFFFVPSKPSRAVAVAPSMRKGTPVDGISPSP